MEKVDDKELFTRIAEGEESAYVHLYKKYYHLLYSYVSKLIKSDLWAEEIVHDVFLSVWFSRTDLHKVNTPLAFLYRITANKAIDWVRKHGLDLKVQYFLAKQQLNVNLNSTQELLDFHAMEHLVHTAVQQLSPQRKIVYQLKQEKGWSYDEIAQELNISKHTVRNQWVKAIKIIQEYLQKHGGLVLLLSYCLKLND